MPRRRGNKVGGVMQTYVASLTRLSESLRLYRPDDHGDIPALLNRADAVTFLNRLAFLASNGTISQNMRIIDCRNVKRVLNDLPHTLTLGDAKLSAREQIHVQER